MFFLMFKDCRERRLGGGEHARRTLPSCGLRGIAAANVGIFVETDKQKRRFVPNLRTGGGELLSLAPAWGDTAVATQRKSFPTRPPGEPTSGGEGETRNFSMLFVRSGLNLGLSAICSQVVTTTSAIFFASSRPSEAPDSE